VDKDTHILSRQRCRIVNNDGTLQQYEARKEAAVQAAIDTENKKAKKVEEKLKKAADTEAAKVQKEAAKVQKAVDKEAARKAKVAATEKRKADIEEKKNSRQKNKKVKNSP